MKIVICGNSQLFNELMRRGHEVHLIEREAPDHAEGRERATPLHGGLSTYRTTEDFKERFSREILNADVVIVGSAIADALAIGRWVVSIAQGLKVFFDFDTPATLECLAEGRCLTLDLALLSKYDLYLSMSDELTVKRVESEFGAACARGLARPGDAETLIAEAVQSRSLAAS